MKYSIVICTYNRPELLAECLSLLAPNMQSIPFDMYEVIVSDDNKNNITRELVENNFPWAKWVKGPENGFASNRNNGVKYTIGEWLLLLDDDCLPSKTWIEGYVNAIAKNTSVKVFEGKTIADRPRERYDEEAPINETGGKFWGCNQCIEKDFFLKLGGVCEEYTAYGMEDIDFKVCILEKEEQILFVSNALVIHPWRQVRPLMKQFKVFDNVFLFLERHPDQFEFYKFNKLAKIAFIKMFKDFKLLIRLRFKGSLHYIGKVYFYLYKACYIPWVLNTKKDRKV